MTGRNAPTLTTMDAVLVEVGGTPCLLPASAIVTIVVWNAVAVSDDSVWVGRLDNGTPVAALARLLYHDVPAFVSTVANDSEARVLIVRVAIAAGEQEIAIVVDRIMEISRVPVSEIFLAPQMIVPRAACPVTWAFWFPPATDAPVPIIDLRAVFADVALAAYTSDEVVA